MVFGIIIIFFIALPSFSQHNKEKMFDFKITDAVFDVKREKLYVTTDSRKRVLFIDLHTVQIENEVSERYIPGPLVLSKDGNSLFVTTSNRETYNLKSNLIEFDLDTQSELKRFDIELVAYDIVVTESGYLYASSRTGSWTEIQSYSLSTGDKVDSETIYRSSLLCLHPDESMIFASYQSGSDHLVFYPISNNGMILDRIDYPYYTSYDLGNEFFISPSGEVGITGGGELFQISLNDETDIVYEKRIENSTIDHVSFNAPNDFFITSTGTSHNYYRLDNFHKIGSIPLENNGMMMDVVNDTVFSLTYNSNEQSFLEKYPHPLIGSNNVNIPNAQFSISPDGSGTTQTQFVLDASGSADPSNSSLLFRWDWESDGVFDTEFVSSPVINKQFTLADTYFVTLEVENEKGFSDAETRSVFVTFTPDLGEIPDYPVNPYEFPFDIKDVVFDGQRSYAYAISKDKQKLYYINLNTGNIDRFFSFDYPLESLTLTPDGSRLYLALLTRAHNGGWFDVEGHSGIIAEFDLDQMMKINQYIITEDPYDIAATDDGHIYVTSGSGQWTYIRSFDAVDGKEIDAANDIRQQACITLHPSQKMIYGSSHEVRGINHWTIFDGSISDHWSVHLPAWQLFISPVGDRLITNGGDMYTTSFSQSDDLQYIGKLSNQPLINDMVFDVLESAVYTICNDEIKCYQLSNYQFVDSILVEQSGQFIGIHGDSIYVVCTNEIGTSCMLRYQKPLLGAGLNTAPVADFRISPDNGTTMTLFRIDASMCSDIETPSDSLLIRWDWDGDGVFDTSFDTTKTLERYFRFWGSRNITLEVKDQFGLISSKTLTLDVAFEADPGSEPSEPNEAYQLPFQFDEVIFDKQRGYCYISSTKERKIFFLNLKTGVIEKEFAFDLMPQRLYITGNGDKLYGSLLTQPYSGSYFSSDEGIYGAIVELDLNLQKKTNQFWIDTEPFDFVVTETGYIYVSSNDKLHSYSASEGIALEKTTLLYRCMLDLHPAEDRIYAANTKVSPSDIEQIQISGGEFGSHWDSPYHGQHRMEGNVFASPNGNMLITAGGDVYSCSLIQEQDMNYVANLDWTYFYSVEFDTMHSVIFTSGYKKMTSYNLHNYQEIESYDVASGLSYVGVYGDSVYLAIQATDTLGRINRYAHPATQGKTNTPPVALFTMTPDSGNTVTTFVFNASDCYDKESPSSKLKVRWDWESDGKFDTNFDTLKTYERQFPLIGVYKITIQVSDEGGLISSIVDELPVAFAPDAGEAPEEDNIPFELGFEINDAMFIPDTPYLYLSSAEEHKVYLVDVETGLIVKVYSFELMPDAFALNLNRDRLFFTLLTDDPEENQKGAISEINVSEQTVVTQFWINDDPEDIVVTSDGFVFITGRSPLKTRIASYNSQNCQLVSAKEDIGYRSKIELNSKEDKIYGLEPYHNRDNIFCYYIHDGKLLDSYQSNNQGEFNTAGGFYMEPNGNFLVTRTGDVLEISDDPENDMVFKDNLINGSSFRVEDIYFDIRGQVIYALVGPLLYQLHYTTHELIAREDLDTELKHVGVYDSNLYIVAQNEGYNKILKIKQSSESSVTNAQMPSNYKLYNNYPNPFNASTHIKIAVPEKSHVTLKVLNVNGQEVVEILDEVLPSGYYSYVWNAENLSTGIYLLQMVTDNKFKDIIKVMYLR